MSLNPVSEQLLSANGLNHQDLFAILGQLTERRLDYGDLYFQSSYHESRVLEDSIIKDGSYNIDRGVGVRAVSGEKTGFAYADQISKLALEQSAQAARTIVRDTGNGKVQTLGAVEHRALYTSIDPLQSMTREEKLDILRRVDKVARAADQRVQEVSASLSGVYELIWSPPPMALWPPTFVRWFVFPSACWWKRMASVSAAAAAVAGVLVMTISSPPRRRRAG